MPAIVATHLAAVLADTIQALRIESPWSACRIACP